MKERIVVENKAFLNKTDFVCIEDIVKDLKVEYKIEQVPETFADVKQLTKEHIDKLKLNKDVWKIDIQKDFIDIEKLYVTHRVRFTSIGNILFDSYLKIAENKTPNELWLGIKSLIGEE